MDGQRAEETAKALSDLAKREVSKGFVLPDVDKLSAHQKKLLEFLLRIPPLNPAAALLMATRFNSLREIATRSVSFLPDFIVPRIPSDVTRIQR